MSSAAQKIDDIFAAKIAAARAATELVEAGMLVGLGSGSTAEIFVELLAGRKLAIQCVASSQRTAALAQKWGLQVVDNFSWSEIDITIDGADEIDPKLNLMKGLGGALLREKWVAVFSKKFVVISDDSKKVQQLGERCPVPVEVPALGRQAARDRLAQLVGSGDDVRLRADKTGKILLTDGGNYIYDCFFGRLASPAATEAELNKRPYVLGHGLFLGMANLALIADKRGKVERLERASDES